MHNRAVGEPPQAYNASEAADGLVGGVLPTVTLQQCQTQDLASP